VPYLLNGVYLLVLLAALPWLMWKALRAGKYREGFGAKFLGLVPRRTKAGPCIWFHAVSVGEVNLLAPLLAEFARRRPEVQCVVSTTTRTGMQLARQKYPELLTCYCPLDFTWAVRRAMARLRPDVLVLVELELWPNLIGAARGQGARVAVINGRLSESSFRGYRRIRRLASQVLGQLDLIAVQDESYRRRFAALGAHPEQLRVTGSMKYDGARTDRDNPATRRLRELAGIEPEGPVLLAGSTQEPEERIVVEAFGKLRRRWPELKLVIVPRHPERFDAVAELVRASGLPWQRRSRLEAEGPAAGTAVLLVDAVGELGAWWGLARIGFVGGSLGNRGGQNMIEPAAYGAAVCFGPNTQNFRDVVQMLLDRQAAVVVADGEELRAFVDRCLAEPEMARELGRRAQSLVVAQLGATERTADLLQSLLVGKREAHRPAA
jgi:3-deoxy-D-manno-octulosonic-acid transferase